MNYADFSYTELFYDSWFGEIEAHIRMVDEKFDLEERTYSGSVYLNAEVNMFCEMRYTADMMQIESGYCMLT